MSRNERIAAAVTVAVVLLIALVVTVRGRQADDARSDGYYCTLAGVSPYDRGPKTGRLCVDLLDD